MASLSARDDPHLTPFYERAAKNSAALLSIIAAAFLILLKTATAWLTGSISVLASLLDSVMDIFSSTLNYLAVRVAARPADEDHRYGHGKAESVMDIFSSTLNYLAVRIAARPGRLGSPLRARQG